MRKTLVIGIGGTGLTAIRELRRLIAERYENGLRDPEVSAVKFIYIDTHEGDLKKLNWSVLGKDIRLTDGEKVIITGDRLQAMIESPEDYPDISPWLPSIKNYVGDPGAGAKGIRPYGRLIYEYNENKNKIQNKIVDCYNALNQSFTQLQDWRFYLVCGLSGGTGSGMFLPFSFDLIRWNLYQKGNTFRKFYSFFVMPALPVVGRHNRYHPNAYAALSELNYQTFQPEGLPYDNCYLLEPKNANGLEIALENLPLLIAQRLFLNIQGGVAADYIDAIMDNPQLGNVEDDKETGRRHSLKFSTFGLSSVTYPKEIVAQCLSYSLAQKLVVTWLEEGVYQQDINQQVKSELQSIRLSLDYIRGDADPFGLKDYPESAVQITNSVDELFQNISKRELGEKVDKIRRQIEEDFRDVGIEEFYKQRKKDVSGAVSESLTQIRLKITSFLRSSQLGLNYVKKFLEELISTLQDFKIDISKVSNDKIEKRILRSKDNLSKTLSEVRIAEKGLLYTRFEKDRANLSDELKLYIKSLAQLQSSQYALMFIEGITIQVVALRNELDGWESRIRETHQNLGSRLKKILEDIQKGTQENGKTIFGEESLRDLLEETNFSLIQSSIEEVIKYRLNQETLDLVSITKENYLEELIYESSYQWVLSGNCPVDVQRVTLYDKFVREYARASQRQEILASAKKLSASFLKFAPSEVGKRAIASTDAAVVTIPEGAGQMSQEGKPAQSVVQEDLEDIGVPSENIKLTPNLERIIFLQEKQVFPLRFIESLLMLREKYTQFPEKQALHIDKRTAQNLYDLFLLSTEEKQALLESEEVFLIARIQNWMTRETNLYTRKSEIRYEVEEVGKLGLQKFVIGEDWEIAFRDFSGDSISRDSKNEQVRNARSRLTDQVRELRKQAKTELGITDTLHADFNRYLQTSSNEYPAGTDDPRYERDRKIINRILDSFQ